MSGPVCTQCLRGRASSSMINSFIWGGPDTNAAGPVVQFDTNGGLHVSGAFIARKDIAPRQFAVYWLSQHHRRTYRALRALTGTRRWIARATEGDSEA